MSRPILMTDALLSSIRTHPHLPRHSWYFIAGTALSALNRPEEVPLVFQHAVDRGVGEASRSMEVEDQLRMARKMREALIKAAAVYGLPKVRSRRILERIQAHTWPS